MKHMIKVHTQAGSLVHLVCNDKNLNQMLELLSESNAEAKAFEVGKMPLNELPVEIQDKVKNILKAFDRVTVTFEHNAFSVSTGTCIRARYNWDHFVCGYYKADEVYTPAERKQNYIECFG